MTEHEQLYQALDSITDGLAAFMAAGRDDTWTCDGWHAFNLTTMGNDGILFGFRARVNGELAPDPQISVRVDHGTRTAEILCVDQLLGYWQAPNIPAGSTGYAIDLLAEMQRRRAAGEVAVSSAREPEQRPLADLLADVATVAMAGALVDPDTDTVDVYYELIARLSEASGLQPPAVDSLTAHALRGGFAALESALYSKDGVEVRNVAALIYLAFQGGENEHS